MTNHYTSYEVSKALWERFMSKVKKTRTCWLWTASLNPNGYGGLHVEGKRYKAHRMAYELFTGEIPKGMFVCHTCDIKKCVNPKHLFLGTNSDNLLDYIRKHKKKVYKSNIVARTGTVFGEKHGSAKLNATKVTAIREKYNTGKYSQLMLAKEYSVVKRTVWNIVNRKTWTHV